MEQNQKSQLGIPRSSDQVVKKQIRLIVVSKKDINNKKDYLLPSDHMCYVIKSETSRRIYVGYTIDFNRRIRQHNGEIVGGAKKTENDRPWVPICKIKGFFEKSSALRFEWRIQHSKKPRPNCITNIIKIINELIIKGDGAIPWPNLIFEWCENYKEYKIENVTNINQ